ncbi:MAG TPA: CRISPR-associated endonuclease Cas3'', partial [Desulfosalsimonadaceae bacterium]|nr:CRISPR-associated endonuclease Cas3'' [Desulfosalsimonadaceae bacterium]
MAFDKRDDFPSYYSYWGKAEKDGSAYHLLPYHCLDVAAVGKVLFAPQQPVCRDVAESLGVSPECLHDFFMFCLALHDLGKFSSAFQGLRKDLSGDLVRANPRITYCERHDSLGFWLWRDVLSKNCRSPDSKGNEWFDKVEPWMKIVTGHHG